LPPARGYRAGRGRPSALLASALGPLAHSSAASHSAATGRTDGNAEAKRRFRRPDPANLRRGWRRSADVLPACRGEPQAGTNVLTRDVPLRREPVGRAQDDRMPVRQAGFPAAESGRTGSVRRDPSEAEGLGTDAPRARLSGVEAADEEGRRMPQVLITGGAGFIGSHVADHLLAAGYRVRVLDNGALQVHGPLEGPPAYLSPAVEYVRGDVCDGPALERALRGVDAVVHLAAMVGVGQSMYEVERYTAVNDLGTAVLMQALLERPVGRLVVASSMSVYGEGRYLSAAGAVHDGVERNPERIRAGDWEPTDGAGGRLRPIATPEDKTPSLRSVYALNKYVQERMS